MPTNAAKKALAKAKRGIVATGACSTKADPNFAALKDNKELPCPHCDRIFKQQDRLKQHIQKQHADVVAEQAVAAGPGDGAGGDGGGGKKISAKAALIQQQAAKAKEDKAREALEKGEKSPVQRMSCKLPSTILREFVQKKTDLKAPLFKSHEVDGGWTCKLVLRDKQGKTEKDRVFWWREKCATKQEAEHRVSVVALAAVAQNLPLQRLLPGEYRSTFADAEEAEKARAENRRARAAREEERIARAKAANKAEPPAVLTMSEEKRGLVESILRETWVSDDDDDDDDVDLGEGDTDDDDDDVNALCDRLTGLGFHREDAMAASKATKSTDPTNLDPAISWLCVHVPETRLPAAYAPQSVNDGGVVLLSKKPRGVPVPNPSSSSSSSTVPDDDSRPEDGDAAWLWDRGYPRAACEAAASDHGGNREVALAALFRSLVLAGESDEISGGVSDADDEDWREELTAIEAIVGEDRVRTLCDGRGVAVGVETNEGILATLEVYRLDGCGYPSLEPPTVAFHAAGASRDRFRLATSKLAKIAVDNIGAPCVYTLFEAAGAMNVVAGASEGDGPALTAREPAKTVPAPRNRSSSAKPSARRPAGPPPARRRRVANGLPCRPRRLRRRTSACPTL